MSHFFGDIDFVPRTFPKSKGVAQLLILEDNEAVLKIIIKGRSPNMRHVPRTQRIDLDWLFERLGEDEAICMRYVKTANQLADLFTKGSFTAQLWGSLCDIAQLGPPQTSNNATSCKVFQRIQLPSLQRLDLLHQFEEVRDLFCQR